MKDANTILNQIRILPEIYLGERSITQLRSLMDGYGWAFFDCTGSNDISATMYQLTWHLTHKYRIRESIDWRGILLSLRNNNEEDALSLFWEEWDDFISQPCTCPQDNFGDDCKIFWRYCRDSIQTSKNSDNISSL